MAAHEDTPSGEMRRAVASGSFAVKGDVNKMAQAMIDCADRSSPALRRLTLGASAYASIRAALTDRISALNAQKDIALSVDANDWTGALRLGGPRSANPPAPPGGGGRPPPRTRASR